jgi:hypothetical protein
MGTFFGPCYIGAAYRAYYDDSKTPTEIHALDDFYPHFLPGDIIVPKDRNSPNFDLHVWVVVNMQGNEAKVNIRPIGATTWNDNSVWSLAYDLATPEEIARAVARRLTKPSQTYSG